MPSTTARMRWMFGFHRRLVRRCEWLTFMPKLGCFPQISQTAAMTRYLGCIGHRPIGRVRRTRRGYWGACPAANLGGWGSQARR